MWGRLPLQHVAVAVALGVASGYYIYRPLFPPSGPPQIPDASGKTPPEKSP